MLETLPGWGVAAFGVWMIAIVVVALLLPLLVLAFYGRYSSVRRALLPYTLVLAAQILTEVLFMRVFVSNIVVVTGLVYTSFQLWQLWSSRKYFRAMERPTSFGRSAVGTLLSLGLVFWTANLLFLSLIALPRVVEL